MRWLEAAAAAFGGARPSARCPGRSIETYTDGSVLLVKFLPFAGLPPLPWRPASLDAHSFFAKKCELVCKRDPTFRIWEARCKYK